MSPRDLPDLEDLIDAHRAAWLKWWSVVGLAVLGVFIGTPLYVERHAITDLFEWFRFGIGAAIAIFSVVAGNKAADPMEARRRLIEKQKAITSIEGIPTVTNVPRPKGD